VAVIQGITVSATSPSPDWK